MKKIKLSNGQIYQSEHPIDRNFYDSSLLVYDTAVLARSGGRSIFFELDKEGLGLFGALLVHAVRMDPAVDVGNTQSNQLGTVMADNRGDPFVKGAIFSFTEDVAVFLPENECFSLLKRLNDRLVEMGV